jgi:hypothetical protein
LTTDPNSQKIDRHPERRFKAAYKAFEERRLPEIEVEHPGLRKNRERRSAGKSLRRARRIRSIRQELWATMPGRRR